MRVMHPSHRPGDTGANNGQDKADGTVPNLIDPPGALELLQTRSIPPRASPRHQLQRTWPSMNPP